jgi:DNA-binding HxlR family transcriptional regulator
MYLDDEIKSILSRQSDTVKYQEGQFLKLQELALRHQQYGVERDAPVRSLLSLVGDKWSVLILGTLRSGICRYTVLRQLIGVLSYEHEISHRVLTAKLRTIERSGLISRRVTANIPPRVYYQLTPLGQEFATLVETLVEWGETHTDMVRKAYQTFDTSPREE